MTKKNAEKFVRSFERLIDSKNWLRKNAGIDQRGMERMADCCNSDRELLANLLVDAMPAEPEKENNEAVERFRQSSLYRAFTPDPFAVPPLALDAGDWVEEEAKKNWKEAYAMGLNDLIAFGLQCVEHGKSDIQSNIDAAVKAEREECAKIADSWTTDDGQSPCHGEALRFGFKVAGQAIARFIRARK